MDIEGQMRTAMESREAAGREAERVKVRTAEAVVVLRAAFAEFIEALVLHKPQKQLVLFERRTVPATQNMFTYTPEINRIEAAVLGSCWKFKEYLLSGDGTMWDARDAKIGDKIEPFSNKWGDRDRFLESALPALSRAGLGDELSDNFIYTLKLPEILDWSDARGWEHRGGNFAGGIELRLGSVSYVVKDGAVFIKVDDGRQDGMDIEVPFDTVCAGYIVNRYE